MVDKFLKHRAYDHLLFAWIRGIRSYLPGVSIEKCIDTFFKHFNVDEKQYNKKSASITYTRLNKEFIEMQKTKSHEHEATQS